MEIYQRKGSPFFYVDTIDPGTGQRTRRSTGQSDRIEAQKEAGRMEVAAEALAEETKNGKRPITLRATLDRYVANTASEGKQSATLYAMMRDKTLGLRPPFTSRHHLDGSRLLHTLQPSDLADLVTARREEGNCGQTIAHELKLLRAATRHAGGLRFRVPEDLTNGTLRNPWRMPKLTSKTRYLSRAEFQKVFEAMTPDRECYGRRRSGERGVDYPVTGIRRDGFRDAQDLLVALALTGGRWQEVAQLSWSQVDFEAGLIRLFAGKTQSERVVPMPDPARRVLERRRDAPDAHPTLIFPGSNGQARGKQSCGPILRAMEKAGLNDPASVAKHGRATVHSLRHTFASWLIQGGADLSEVQGALGHATLQMTIRYAHLSQTKTVSKLNKVLASSFDDGLVVRAAG